MPSTSVIQIKSRKSNFTDITTGSTNGTGLFDELMASVKQHLQEEYSANRIRNTEYSKVYLGSIEAVLAQTVQYLTANALIDAQRTKLELEAELLKGQLQMLPYQIEKVKAESEIARYQVEQIKLQLELIPFEKQKIMAEVNLLNGQLQKLDYEIRYLMPLQKAQMTLQNSRLNAELALINSQNRELVYKIDQLYPVERQKSLSEISLINAKTATEALQPMLAETQRQLMITQREGFLREAETKAAKLLVDSWSVQKSVDEGVHVPAGLQNPEIHRAMAKVLAGIRA